MKPFRLLPLLIILPFTGITQTPYTSLVNPFIGTGGHGHTFPGATLPFGMMQLSPDTRLEGWDGCSGYHYSDSIIYGFSHTHLSGTGVGDYCDVLLMPFTGKVAWKNRDYASPFSHANEKATPGYYEVFLDKYKVRAQLTTSRRSGMHAYTFEPGAATGSVLLDLQHRDEVLESSLEIVNDHEIKGMRRSKSWAQNQYLYFYIRFDRPFSASGIALNDELQPGIKTAHGKNLKSFFDFDVRNKQTLYLKVGISAVSAENARLNMETEIPEWNFDRLRQSAQKEWQEELGKIEVGGGTYDQQVAFYTALYHTMLAPNLYMDVNGDYRGTDLKVHKANDFTNYTVFSLWDTYRALHPLHAILDRRRTNDWIRTFLAQYQQGGMMPVWELSGNETFCMIGYHSVPVIADAWQKGIRNFDPALALKAMTSYAESKRFGLPAYMQQGFVSNADDHESASKTMEYAYDDWCISRFAQWTGQEAIHKKYRNRSLQYRNLFDPASRHIRGKVQGFWQSPFVPGEINNFFTEGNSWHYSFAAPHDIDGMIRLYGGKEAFAQKLEALLDSDNKISGREQADVTGLIGQYAHGNEPSHHMAYLFNYCGKPWRTQELVNRICRDFYANSPDGLIGNEDCGQMSAWLVFSAMGFYPVTPGSGEYALGTPLFNEIKLHLENGKTFYIRSKNHGPDNFYVNRVALNGNEVAATFIRHSDLANGGELIWMMSNEPNKQRGVDDKDMPHTSVNDAAFTAVPYFDMEHFKFKGTLPVILKHLDDKAVIWYSVKETGKPATAFIRYSKPFNIGNNALVKMYAQKNGVKSPVVQQQFYRINTDRSVRVESKVHPMYTAGGPDALLDGIQGTENWRAGDWQSYFDQDFVAVVDLQREQPVQYVGVHVLQDVSPWILYPKTLVVETSLDGVSFSPLTKVENKVGTEMKGPVTQTLGAAVNTRARYVRIKAVSGGPLPAGHESAGSPSHLFIDELIIR